MLVVTLNMSAFSSLFNIVLIIFILGDAVVNVYINHEKKFAFVEMRTVEEASNAMALDGIVFEACRASLLLFSFTFILFSFSFLQLFGIKKDFNGIGMSICHKPFKEQPEYLLHA